MHKKTRVETIIDDPKKSRYYCVVCHESIVNADFGCECGKRSELPVGGKRIKTIPSSWITLQIGDEHV